MRWAIGSRGGNVGGGGAIGNRPTLGGGDMPTLGGGVSANVIRRGVTVVTTGARGRRAETAGGGGAN